MARYVSNRDSSTQRKQAPDLCVPRVELPDWFPWIESSQTNSVAERPRYIFCQHATMQKLENAGHSKITAIYGELVVEMWNTGRKQKRAKGRITYKHMTPTWLRRDIIFIYGPNRNYSIPFTQKRLPTKSEIRDMSNKNLAMAILSSFLSKEKSISSFLIALFRKSGIDISDSENSSSTINLIDGAPRSSESSRDNNSSSFNIPGTNISLHSNSGNIAREFESRAPNTTALLGPVHSQTAASAALNTNDDCRLTPYPTRSMSDSMTGAEFLERHYLRQISSQSNITSTTAHNIR